MKVKYIVATIVVILAAAWALAFWWPATQDEGQNGLDHGGHTEEEERAAGAEENHDGHGHGDHPQEDDGHDDHDEEAGEEEHGDEVVRLSAAQRQEFGIVLTTARSGRLNNYVELPGEIVLNADRLAHVVPRVSGLVRQVHKSVGDTVQEDEVMALLESRELADAKAAYLAAVERHKLALANFQREERLWADQITSEQEFLVARQLLAEARINRSSAKQQLHALGFSADYLKTLPTLPDVTYTLYEIRAPFAGTVIERHLTLGEHVTGEAEVFTIADLATVWVDLNVYQKDLAQIRQGLAVQIDTGQEIEPVHGEIAWVGPLVAETTRTARARVVLANPAGTLRPGLFVTARVAVEGSTGAAIVVAKSALQTFEGGPVVFVRTPEGLEPRAVEVGRQSATQVEILSGLERGQEYVSQGAFTLKAQLSKGAFGDGHNH